MEKFSDFSCYVQQKISDSELDNLIKTSTNPDFLNELLDLKLERLAQSQTTTLTYSVDEFLALETSDIDLKCKIIRKLFAVVENSDQQMLAFLNNILCTIILNEDTDDLTNLHQLLCSTLEGFLAENKTCLLSPWTLKRIDSSVQQILNNSLQHSNHLLTKRLLRSYVQLGSNSAVIQTVFSHVNSSKSLNIMCTNFEDFVTHAPSVLMESLLSEEFCEFLSQCLVGEQNLQQKQAAHVLSETVKYATQQQSPLLDQQSLIRGNLSSENELQSTWRNFFILLDVSNEKQLHLVEPSLNLLQTISGLHPLWQACIYKRFLSHSQNLVSYFVCAHILENTSWDVFSQLAEDFLCALNKHEFCTTSNGVFEQLSRFRKTLTQSQYEFFWDKSLRINWIPSAFWCFCRSVFGKNPQAINLPVALFEKFMNFLKLIPDTFIRQACAHQISAFFLPSYTFDTLQNFMKVLLILKDLQDIGRVILENRSTLRCFEKELHHDFISCLNSKTPIPVHRLKTLSQIFQLLGWTSFVLKNLTESTSKSFATDLLYLEFFRYLNHGDVEKYLIERLKQFVLNENSDYFLQLYKLGKWPAVFHECDKILQESNSSSEFLYNNTQMAIAFFEQSFHSDSSWSYKTVMNFWPTRIRSGVKTDEKILTGFLNLLFTSLSHESELDNITDFEELLSDVLESQNDSAKMVVYKHFGLILTLLQNSKLHLNNFMRLSFQEVLKFDKISLSREALGNLLGAISTENVMEICQIDNRLVNFMMELLESPAANAVAYILSKNLAVLTSRFRYTLRYTTFRSFIPAIIELILFGIVVQKTERVDYFVYQQILHDEKHSTSLDNPNLQKTAVRLHALNSMMNLVITSPVPKKVTMAEALVAKYMTHFGKRYFPDSQIHLEKLRIIQALLLIQPYMSDTDDMKIVDLIIDSFLAESHQPSVRHLMQWLLINLLKSEFTLCPILLISQKLREANISRPSSVCCLIPVLYHLTLTRNDETKWQEVIDILLPFTMGAQFKLRLYSQVAILKLYEEAAKKNYADLRRKYKFCESISAVLEASRTSPESGHINSDFFDYSDLISGSCETIYLVIPQKNDVTCTEWQNLHKCSQLAGSLNNLKFTSQTDLKLAVEKQTVFHCDSTKLDLNIQKKIVPCWHNFDDAKETIGLEEFVLVTSLLEKSANLGGLSRTCEVFGVKQIVMRTAKIVGEKEFKSLSMSSENWVNVIEVKATDLEQFFARIKTDGYSICGAEQTRNSTRLDRFKFPKKTVLVLGNEKEGIPANLIPFMDFCIEIPQFGMVRSLNVHVAGAIVMWEYCKQHLL